MIEERAHATQLTLETAAAKLEHLRARFPTALRRWLLAEASEKKRIELPIFEALYGYGQSIAGPRPGTGKFGKIMTPCVAKPACQECRRLIDVIHNHRPVTIVLEGSCEEFLAYEQIPAPMIRRAPLRFYSRGETIGINRLLNLLYQQNKPVRSIFGGIARQLVSGAQSIFFATSIKNPRVAQHVLLQVPREILQKHLGRDFELPQRHLAKAVQARAKALAAIFENDHWTFFKILADAAIAAGISEPWSSRVLFVPAEPLAAILGADRKTDERKDLLIAALAEQFLSSRNTRSEPLRQLVVRDRLSAPNLFPYEAATIQHLVETIRGEFPGFQPHHPGFGDDFGPYHAAQEYLHRTGLTELAFADAFPAILRPVHFNSAKHRFFYYSFEKPTLIAPVGKKGVGRKFPANVDTGLQALRAERPDLFDSADWRLFLSGGKPPGPPETTKSKPQRASVQTAPYQSLLKDFLPLIEDAVTRKWLPQRNQGMKQAKWGFMAGLIRVSRSAQRRAGSEK